MKWIEVHTSGPLRGEIEVPGSKNSSLALLAAACLADEPVRLRRLPDIADLQIICDIGADIGVRMARQPSGDIVVDPTSIHRSDLDPQKTSAYRASYYFIGALLSKFQKITLGYPGGDDFGQRPIDQHIKGLEALGATFRFQANRYTVEAARLVGADIYFDMVTSGATINLILAAVLAKGTTTLHNAAMDPEIVDVANLLNMMGARVRGAGTSTIRIEGVQQLGGCTHTAIPDRLIAGTFLIAAGATAGEITVKGIIPEHLRSCATKLQEIGIHIESNDESITAMSEFPLRATRVRTAMYPGFATDLQQPLSAALLQAAGRSIITDRVYPKRYNHIHQLKRMNADVEVKGRSAFINGQCPLQGAWVHATDVRAGACLILAGVNAEGVTRITGVTHIERGYENVVDTFLSLGANIKLCTNDQVEREDEFCL